MSSQDSNRAGSNHQTVPSQTNLPQGAFILLTNSSGGSLVTPNESQRPHITLGQVQNADSPPAIFAPANSHTVDLSDVWSQRWGRLQPGDAFMHMSGNVFNAGGKVSIVNVGTRHAKIESERNIIHSPEISRVVRGAAGGTIDIQNQFNGNCSFENNINGNVVQWSGNGNSQEEGKAPKNESGSPSPQDVEDDSIELDDA